MLKDLVRLAELEAAERAAERGGKPVEEGKVTINGPEDQVNALSELVEDGETYRAAATSPTAMSLLVERFWAKASDEARGELAGFVCGLAGIRVTVVDPGNLQEPAPAAPVPEPDAGVEVPEPSPAVPPSPVQAPPVAIPEPPDEIGDDGIPTFVHRTEPLVVTPEELGITKVSLSWTDPV